MAMIEAVLAVVLLAFLVYAVLFAVFLVTRRPAPKPSASVPGQWRVVHYDDSQETRVGLQKVDAAGNVVDEHAVAAIPVDDPEYDGKFLSAMSVARERRALFEAEEES